MDLRVVFEILTSATVVCLAYEAGVDVSEVSSDVASAGDQTVGNATRAPQPTESSEVQAYINRLFTFPSKEKLSAAPSTSTIKPWQTCGEKKDFYFLEDGYSFNSTTAAEVDELLKLQPHLVQLYNHTDMLVKDNELGDRDFNDDGLDLCLSVTKLVSPLYVVPNKKDEVLEIAQSNKLRQQVRVQICRTEHCPCAKEVVNFLNRRVKSRCQQKYIYRDLLVVNKHGETKLVSRNVPIPSCCACLIYTDDSNERTYANLCKKNEANPARDGDVGAGVVGTSSGSQVSESLVLVIAALCSLYSRTKKSFLGIEK